MGRAALCALALLALPLRAAAGDPVVPELVAPVAGVDVETEFTPWTLRAVTRQQMLTEIVTKGPCGKLACTEWSIEPQFSFKAKGGRCFATVVRTRVFVNYRLPEWKPAKPVSEAVRASWRTELAEVLAHEGHHRDLAVETANTVQQTVSALPPGPTCTELISRGKVEALRLIDAGEQRQRAYDTPPAAEQEARSH